ncbi:MAG: hypothetical protein PHW60_11155 [Kiritimatiellae bacterium]|nr:hypothetical protein [Kiritimatiellia bacterium]
MILLFDPAPPCIQWCLVRNGSADAHAVEAKAGWQEKITADLDGCGHVKTIGYVLHNGGDTIRDAVGPITKESLARLADCVNLLPEHNSLTLAACRHWMECLPNARHILLCDTAFFAHLPSHVRDYAVPHALTRRGLHRYGGSGLGHEWAWKQIQALTGGAARKIVSIHLGNHSNLAAIQDGHPLETTVGFTHLEGIMSAEGCGDIDPTIIFQLKAAGFTYSIINRMLSTQSGFSALAGKPCQLSDILVQSSPSGLALARRVFLYQIVKYTGALLAALDGADAFVLHSAPSLDIMPFVREICQAFAFLGIRLQPEAGRCNGMLQQVSTADSAMPVFVMACDRWTMLNRWIQSLANKKEHAK